MVLVVLVCLQGSEGRCGPRGRGWAARHGRAGSGSGAGVGSGASRGGWRDGCRGREGWARAGKAIGARHDTHLRRKEERVCPRQASVQPSARSWSLDSAPPAMVQRDRATVSQRVMASRWGQRFWVYFRSILGVTHGRFTPPAGVTHGRFINQKVRPSSAGTYLLHGTLDLPTPRPAQSGAAPLALALTTLPATILSYDGTAPENQPTSQEGSTCTERSAAAVRR